MIWVSSTERLIAISTAQHISETEREIQDTSDGMMKQRPSKLRARLIFPRLFLRAALSAMLLTTQPTHTRESLVRSQRMSATLLGVSSLRLTVP